jgi:hypothetical protein
MGGGTFSTLQLPSDMVDTAAVVAAETLMKFLREIGYFSFFILFDFWLVLCCYPV